MPVITHKIFAFIPNKHKAWLFMKFKYHQWFIHSKPTNNYKTLHSNPKIQQSMIWSDLISDSQNETTLLFVQTGHFPQTLFCNASECSSCVWYRATNSPPCFPPSPLIAASALQSPNSSFQKDTHHLHSSLFIPLSTSLGGLGDVVWAALRSPWDPPVVQLRAQRKERGRKILIRQWALPARRAITFSQDCFIQKPTMPQWKPLLIFNIF